MKIITIFILVVIIFSPGIRAFAQGDQATVEKVLKFYQSGNYRQLYNMMAVETLTLMPYEGMVEVLNIEKKILGDLTDYVLIEEAATEINSKPRKIFRYVADFQRGQGFIILTFIKDGGEVKLVNFHIDSPAFLKPESKKIIDEFTKSQEYFPIEEE